MTWLLQQQPASLPAPALEGGPSARLPSAGATRQQGPDRGGGKQSACSPLPPRQLPVLWGVRATGTDGAGAGAAPVRELLMAFPSHADLGPGLPHPKGQDKVLLPWFLPPTLSSPTESARISRSQCSDRQGSSPCQRFFSRRPGGDGRPASLSSAECDLSACPLPPWPGAEGAPPHQPGGPQRPPEACLRPR